MDDEDLSKLQPTLRKIDTFQNESFDQIPVDTPQSQNAGLDFEGNEKDEDGSDEGTEGYEFDSNNPYSNF